MSDPIRFEGIQRSFDGQPVLSDFSLSVASGEIYALLGRNGAGKTTALSILLGFLRPMAGRAYLLGEPSEALSNATRLATGLITEGHVLYRWMSVDRALRFERETRPNFDVGYAAQMIARLGLPRSRLIFRLSRGQQAQLSLVFAMAGDPRVLILDDPAMGLDPVMRREFLDAMIDLLGREGRSVLFSSHILADVERVADRVGILHGGRLIVDARLDELKQRVQKRFARGIVNGEQGLRELPGVLRARYVREGFELVLLDLDDARESALRERCSSLSEPETLTLEELFIELTSENVDLVGTRSAGAA